MRRIGDGRIFRCRCERIHKRAAYLHDVASGQLEKRWEVTLLGYRSGVGRVGKRGIGLGMSCAVRIPNLSNRNLERGIDTVFVSDVVGIEVPLVAKGLPLVALLICDVEPERGVFIVHVFG